MLSPVMMTEESDMQIIVPFTVFFRESLKTGRNLALNGCVDWARENGVELITAEHMAIINDKRSKEKNK